MTENSIAWVQRADSSIDDIKEQTSQGASKALREVDWEKERLAEHRLGAFVAVAPSLGLGAFGDDHFINIIPKYTDTAEVLYAWKRAGARRILGILSFRSSEIDQALRENVPFSQIDDIIHAYFQKDAPKLRRLMQVDVQAIT